MSESVFDESRMPENDVARLLAIFRKPQGTQLPERLVYWYWEVASAAHRLGVYALDERLLITAAVQFTAEQNGKGEYADIPKDARTFADDIADGKAKQFTKVIVKLGGKEREGNFLRAIMTDGIVKEVVVQVGTEERRFKPDAVRLAA